MFRLLRYFSIASLVSIAIASVLLGMVYREIAMRELFVMGEKHNVDITRAFANSLWPEFAEFVKSSGSLNPEQLRNHPRIKKLNAAVYAQANGLSALKIKIYDTQGHTVYSSDARQIGEDASGNQGVRAALSGEIVSSLVHRNQFNAFDGVVENANVLQSYIPIRSPDSGKIEAVFELYDNVTPFLRRITRTQSLVMLAMVLVFMALYGALFLIVRRADAIIKTQILEMKQQRETLLESQALLARTQYAVDHAGDMVFWTDESGHFIYVNETSCRRLGYPCGELFALNVWDIDPDYPKEAWPQLWERLKREKQFTLDSRHRTKSGEVYPAEVMVNYVTFEGKEFGCAFARDVTERKRNEAELIRARDAAEAASRVKTLFLANMSHELRTPMNGILGMVDLALTDSNLSNESREYLMEARNSAQDLMEMLKKVLTFAEIETGRAGLIAKPFFLATLTADALAACRPRAKAKSLGIASRILPGTSEVVVGDAECLRQILDNLLDNAVKFTEKGEIQLTVAPLETTPDSVMLKFSVQDSGVGIAADKLHLIFEAFTQADQSSTRKYGGTGLGLAICTHLVALMGGRIWSDSQVGKGSTFHFTARFGLPG